MACFTDGTCCAQEEDPEKYQKHFSAFIAEELEADDLEEMYKGVRTPQLTLLCCQGSSGDGCDMLAASCLQQ